MLMIIRSTILYCLFCVTWVLSPLEGYTQDFELRDGDRVVLVGDGLIERAQRFGYIEATLSAKWPDRNITFRNIGWSGDTVKGEARDHYTNPPTAYEHLLEQIGESNPTVLIMGYGGYLAFEDDAGLEAFRKDYHALLDDVNLDDKRCALLSPTPHEQRSSPHPDVSIFNNALEKATAVISEIADERGCAFFDLFSSIESFNGVTKEPLTTNGVHFTRFGYALVAELFGNAPMIDQSRHLVIDLEKQEVKGGTWIGSNSEKGKATILVTPFQVAATGTRSITIRGLQRGIYQVATPLGVIGTKSRAEWEEGAVITIADEKEQADKLRSEIIEKNAFYFRKYRPQNETYLVGFRKYEQGQNAVELDLLDPLIQEKENEIGRLKTPIPITLTIERL